MPPLIVLDTGVVVRALKGNLRSSSSEIVRAVGTGRIRLALSDDFLSELVLVMRYSHVEQRIGSAGRAFEVALDLGLMGRLYRPRRYDRPSVTDPKDGWMLDLAWASEADCIVTWDPHLTGARLPFSIEVLEPHQCSMALAGPPPEDENKEEVVALVRRRLCLVPQSPYTSVTQEPFRHPKLLP